MYFQKRIVAAALWLCHASGVKCLVSVFLPSISKDVRTYKQMAAIPRSKRPLPLLPFSVMLFSLKPRKCNLPHQMDIVYRQHILCRVGWFQSKYTSW